MGFEAVYGIGAVLLLAALIFGVLRYHYRDRRAVREVARERYKKMRRDRSLDFIDRPASTVAW